MNEIMEREAEIVNQNMANEKYIATCSLHEGVKVVFDIKMHFVCPLCHSQKMVTESTNFIEKMKAKIEGYNKLLEKLEAKIISRQRTEAIEK